MKRAEQSSPNDKVREAFGARLTEFERHRKELVAMLRNEYERRPKPKPFDEKKSWDHLSVCPGTI
jgi:hypothetical protein